MLRRREDRVAVNGNSPIIGKDVAGDCNVGARAGHPARTLGQFAGVMPPTIFKKKMSHALFVVPACRQAEHPIVGYDAIGRNGPAACCRNTLPDTPFDAALLD